MTKWAKAEEAKPQRQHQQRSVRALAGVLSYRIRINIDFVLSVNVDYTPNGVNATFPDGSPVRTSVTMTFTELRPLTRQDIQEGF